ncbi:hypothetical protein K7X08_033895 [Anisodus acutangulus]|uniref:Uncharacterized protein n=1 Tax=Anisodus acutangulus TaxID=402998 RepID=A0A9Q1RD23_9SOLA|nr:hypothetical protein K7X08_033895 [Anisodus acutangulus]
MFICFQTRYHINKVAGFHYVRITLNLIHHLLKAKKERGVNISKYRHKGLTHYDLLQEIFLNSIPTGNHVVYSTMPISQPTTEEPIEVENDVFSCDNNLPVLPMSMNIGSGTDGGKRIMCDAFIPTDGVTSTRCKKSLGTTANGIFEYLKENLKGKRDMEKAKEKEKRE